MSVGRLPLVRRRSAALRIAAVLLAVALAACSKNPPPDEPEPGSPDADIVVIVENRRSDDALVEIVRDGQRQRLGLITAQNTSSFVVPWARLVNASRVVLTVHPIGTNERYVSDNLVMRPGSEVSLTVNQILRQSYVSVY
ncbi:MAG TPA: hypothetical protein VFK09_00360 [Gemmatimonadales bacterium]|nr:hypothetical protein [Gemmatimonadales bacterium]